jgi:2-phospho-L-lactate transferase/gluconeogenesis factor (CofD/UPF0052 family)
LVTSKTANSIPPAGLRVVAIGGGTGLSTLLRGLKLRVPHASGLRAEPPTAPLIADLTAVVTVTDDGGSSGRLRRDFNMLPPGDLRNCMVALSEDERLISRLFRHRFRNGGDLEGHNFGNLFIAALTEMTGDFAQAIRLSAEILATRGHIFPATAANVTVVARMEDGIVTNLLVDGIPEALGAAQATRVFICNLMTQANESLHLTASQHIERIYEHAGRPIFDYALVNTAPVSRELRERYAAEGAEATIADLDRIESLGIQCITGNFADEGNVLRHAADRVTDALLSLPVRAAAVGAR